ncbi:MAG: NAD(P)/FAD-dependent oxidoreductase [Pseudomonadota bacterium]
MKTAIIAGAGPAGLTAAHELLAHTDVKPVVIELDTQVGGISKTINYRGNRMDLGGHRFFSKSDWVMNWWQSLLPVAAGEDTTDLALTYQGQSRPFTAGAAGNAEADEVMLVRSRLSRIYYRRKFFDYPLKVNLATVTNLGFGYMSAVGLSYMNARLFPRRNEVSLEDFLINRFGDRLYRTFFKDYTEKVWGVPCSEISAEWGAQRIKGLSISKAIGHALLKPFRALGDTRQKKVETSLIERFLYPKFGPGQMWEVAAKRMQTKGGELRLQHRVVELHTERNRVSAVSVRDETGGGVTRLPCDYFFSTMPVKDLTAMLKPADVEIARVASALPYRDFMTVGLLVRKMRPTGKGAAAANLPPDNWIYVQEPDVKLGRLQIFNNWSPHLVADANTVWLGLEYFCSEGDALWSMRDPEFLDFAARELAKIGLIDLADVLDGTVVRVPKAYPAYFGEYRGIGAVRSFLDEWDNVFPIGRNGMHRYNNQDHSMLAAKAAVESIAQGASKKAIWAVNAEDEYHEARDGRS